MKGSVQREQLFDAAESKTLGMCGSSMRENREIPETLTPDGGVGRSEKAESRKFDMHVSGKSDGLIVPTKRANKTDTHRGMGPCVPAAEPVEGRGSIKGNAAPQAVDRTQSRSTTSTGLWGVRQAASRDRKARFRYCIRTLTSG